MKPHRFPLRVYYEDTDAGGIVYYANYLKFIERARSEWIASLGLDQNVLRDQDDVLFAVRRVEADYLRPARLWDALSVDTSLIETSAARLTLLQEVFSGEILLFTAKITLVALNTAGRPQRLPQALRALSP